MDKFFITYAKQVEKMMNLQQSFFDTAGKAKKGAPSEVWAARKQLLNQSKAQEEVVRRLTEEILLNQ